MQRKSQSQPNDELKAEAKATTAQQADARDSGAKDGALYSLVSGGSAVSSETIVAWTILTQLGGEKPARAKVVRSGALDFVRGATPLSRSLFLLEYSQR